MRLALLFAPLLLLAGCAERVSLEDFEATQRMAEDALNRAEDAESRVHDLTMRVDDLESAKDEQAAEIGELESRIDTICQLAPNACW